MASVLLAVQIAPIHATIFFAVVLFLYATLRHRRLRRLTNPRELPYPPGPKPRLLIGNLFDIARGNEASSYQRLANEYGDLVFLSTFGKHVLFVNSFETANELFEKRSANYSDRMETTMSHDLYALASRLDQFDAHQLLEDGMGLQLWTYALRLVDQFYESSSVSSCLSGDRWRKHRRMFHRQFQQSVASTYWPIQRREAHALLRRLLDSPNNLDYHLRHNAAAVIMGVTYGITIASTDDQYIALAEKALEGMGAAASPGAFLVDLIPSLKYVPEWFPGASFKRKAREWRAAVMGMRDAPFATVVKEMKGGNPSPSFVSNLLNELDAKENIEDEVETIKNCAGLTYAAGAESTVSALASFILAILLNPEVQVKAQKELDSIVGRDRLPDFSDRPSLPYISAVLKEVLRWNPIAPLGLPHMVTRDDEYNGYFIPAGTIVVGNSWGILNNPKSYPNPRRFNPDRFMGKGDGGPGQHLSPTDTLSAAFGYGRRFCPGRHMGEAQVWVSIACILSVFDISPALDEAGRPIEVTPAFSPGMIW
ncbi:hypothetical protein GALMADRAFT_144803 [Galerina marginata CBS 339.88]|uniref:Cytochrome P450 n=1 Tax=Galerina marginata (strain CBS 339.88) TaxID=685588 RepID=A0A067STN4_GALM3|nr:hypothetical protein GALMADRAFT_144803 [Galerina marginata CBS 339.88]